MTPTQRTITLPESHLKVLEEEARRMGLSVDQALAQAIRVYQASNHPMPERRLLLDLDAPAPTPLPVEPEDLSWEQTGQSLQVQARLLDAIHEAYPGKDQRQQREDLCRPHREICVRLHYRRIALVRAMPPTRKA